MSAVQDSDQATEALELAARLAIAARHEDRPLDPLIAFDHGPSGFNIALQRQPRDPLEVITELDRAAQGRLGGMTSPGYMGWVIGGSHPVGVAADWLAASWGQNACLHNSSPAASDAEAASAAWLLDLLDLPRSASVGFTTGATMAAFTALAAARLAVLERAGHDFERKGLFGCPEVAIYICDDAHVTNYSVLRYLGFGDEQIRRVTASDQGTFDIEALDQRMRADHVEARIVIAQAGHIMSGGFDDFGKVSALCREFGAWLHVDGAFGLWIRASKRLRQIAHDVDLADSWSVDGHKWLQLPYDCGFAIVRHEGYHRRAMTMQAGYLPEIPDVRDNSDYVPELSRRARGFAAWAVMRAMGSRGISDMVERHCDASHRLAKALRALPGVEVLNRVHLNQLAVDFTGPSGSNSEAMANRLNAQGEFLVRTAKWQGRTVMRFSIINGATNASHIARLVTAIEQILGELHLRAA